MLIECPECSRKISNQARFCLGCGYSVYVAKTQKKTICYKNFVPEGYELVKINKTTAGDTVFGIFFLIAIVVVIAICCS